MSIILKWAGSKSGLAAEEGKCAMKIILVPHIEHVASL